MLNGACLLDEWRVQAPAGLDIVRGGISTTTVDKGAKGE
jgi:hypothetical protein